jgi:hypothetical protein
MKVIGAGLPRTATTTQMFALEQLLAGPCYHMRDLLMDLEAGLPLWEQANDGSPQWEQIFGEARSTVDWPSARYYRDLMSHYPEAKVLLSVREPEEWVRSMRATVWGIFHGDSVIHHVCRARAVVDPLWRRYTALMHQMTWQEGTGVLAGETFTDAGTRRSRRPCRPSVCLYGILAKDGTRSATSSRWTFPRRRCRG